MKSLSNQQDVESTKQAMEKAPSFFLNIPDTKTPWYLVGLDYADGYVHWYETGGGRRRVVCAGGLEGKGFATDTCPICAHVLELYQESKRLTEEGDASRAKALKDRANNLHAKPEVQFKAYRGQRTLLKTRTGKEWVADFDASDTDSTAGVGIISMSESQFDGLTGLIKGESTPFIENGDDLGKRVLWTNKERRKGKTSSYSAVVWSADAEETPAPTELEIPKELAEMDLSENFKIDSEEIEKVYTLISGQTVETPADDDPVATESEGDSAEAPADAELDDLPDDADPETGDAEGDGFEDDIPGEEEPAPKATQRPAVAARPAARPATPAARPAARPAAPAARPATGKTGPSGKVRM